jgi:hypothetical protein
MQGIGSWYLDAVSHNQTSTTHTHARASIYAGIYILFPETQHLLGGFLCISPHQELLILFIDINLTAINNTLSVIIIIIIDGSTSLGLDFALFQFLNHVHSLWDSFDDGWTINANTDAHVSIWIRTHDHADTVIGLPIITPLKYLYVSITLMWIQQRTHRANACISWLLSGGGHRDLTECQSYGSILQHTGLCGSQV